MNGKNAVMTSTMNRKLILGLSVLAFALAACGGREPEPAQGSSTQTGGASEAAEDHLTETAHVALTPAQLQSSGITLAEVGPRRIREVLPLYGVIAPNAERVRDVAARFPGVIREVVRKVGDHVREGDTLATVEANESLETYAVTAPLSGVISARNANPGEQTGDRTLFTVADLSTVWVEISLFPRDIAKVHVGQSVRVRSDDAGLETNGKLVYVAPFGQSVNQTLTARVLVDNPQRRWAPGLYVTAEVTLSETTAPLGIRSEAVQTLDGRSVVFVKGDEGFAPTEVMLGRNDGEFTEVLSGLDLGQTYVATNSFILKAELGKGAAAHED